MTNTKRSAPPKQEGGLNKVLFIRATSDLLTALDHLAAKQEAQVPGSRVSRAGIARILLYRAIALEEAQ